MKKNILEIKKKLRPNGYFCIVIGDCVVRGIKIEVHKFLMKIMEKEGYDSVKYFSYIIKNPYLRIPRSGKGGQTILDHVVIMKK